MRFLIFKQTAQWCHREDLGILRMSILEDGKMIHIIFQINRLQDAVRNHRIAVSKTLLNSTIWRSRKEDHFIRDSSTELPATQIKIKMSGTGEGSIMSKRCIQVNMPNQYTILAEVM